MNDEPGFWRMLIGAAGTVLLVISGALARLFSAKVDRLETATNAQFRDVWGTINDEREATTASRERMWDRLGQVPTRQELHEMEARIRADIRKGN